MWARVGAARGGGGAGWGGAGSSRCPAEWDPRRERGLGSGVVDAVSAPGTARLARAAGSAGSLAVSRTLTHPDSTAPARASRTPVAVLVIRTPPLCGAAPRRTKPRGPKSTGRVGWWTRGR
ncbi:hypothetical protein STTU_6001 [Streptomyces sp. Tu6071]|nr:hypothetical protein STTU_6001 [Streptomyces sp. Tu6071]